MKHVEYCTEATEVIDNEEKIIGGSPTSSYPMGVNFKNLVLTKDLDIQEWAKKALDMETPFNDSFGHNSDKSYSLRKVREYIQAAYAVGVCPLIEELEGMLGVPCHYTQEENYLPGLNVVDYEGDITFVVEYESGFMFEVRSAEKENARRGIRKKYSGSTQKVNVEPDLIYAEEWHKTDQVKYRVTYDPETNSFLGVYGHN